MCYELGQRPRKRKTNEMSDDVHLLRELPDGREEMGVEEGMEDEEKKRKGRKTEREQKAMSSINMAFMPDSSSEDESDQASSIHELNTNGTSHLLKPQRCIHITFLITQMSIPATNLNHFAYKELEFGLSYVSMQ